MATQNRQAITWKMAEIVEGASHGTQESAGETLTLPEPAYRFRTPGTHWGPPQAKISKIPRPENRPKQTETNRFAPFEPLGKLRAPDFGSILEATERLNQTGSNPSASAESGGRVRCVNPTYSDVIRPNPTNQPFGQCSKWAQAGRLHQHTAWVRQSAQAGIRPDPGESSQIANPYVRPKV